MFNGDFEAKSWKDFRDFERNGRKGKLTGLRQGSEEEAEYFNF